MQGCRRGEGRGIKESISPPGEAYAKAAMRAMRIGEQVAGASYRQGCIEQHADELANALRELSQYVALERQEGQWKLNIGWDLIPMEDPVLRIEGNVSGYWPANTPSGNWPAPTCSDAFTDKLKSAQQKEGSMHSVNLSQAVKMWPTPIASDGHAKGYRFPSVERRREIGKAISLAMEVQEPQVGGQLNPTWVEMLMGWPRKWTALEPMNRNEYIAWLMGFSHDEKRRDAEALRMLREGNDPQEVREPVGGLGGVQQAPVLLPELREYPYGPDETRLIEEGSEAPEGSVRGVRVQAPEAGASHRPEQPEQRTGEHTDPLQALPRLLAHYGEKAWKDGSWENAEPRVATGIAARVDRLKAIGNGQVPHVAALAWTTLYSRIQRR
jgi:hypothetical protein